MTISRMSLSRPLAVALCCTTLALSGLSYAADYGSGGDSGSNSYPSTAPAPGSSAQPGTNGGNSTGSDQIGSDSKSKKKHKSHDDSSSSSSSSQLPGSDSTGPNTRQHSNSGTDDSSIPH